MKIGITKCLKINSYSNYSDHNIHDNRKHNTQYWHTFKRGFLKNSNALQKSYRDTWHSIIRASAICISSMVKAKVGSTGVAGHKPCNSRLSATVWHAQQMREISWWRPKCKENRIEKFKSETDYWLNRNFIYRQLKTSVKHRKLIKKSKKLFYICAVWEYWSRNHLCELLLKKPKEFDAHVSISSGRLFHTIVPL